MGNLAKQTADTIPFLRVKCVAAIEPFSSLSPQVGRDGPATQPSRLRASKQAEGPGLGAFHAAEIAYVFNNLDRLKRPVDEADRKLADAMSTAWTAFARTGDRGLPEWKPYNTQDEPAIAFGATVQLVNHVRQEKLDMLEGLLQKRRQAAVR